MPKTEVSMTGDFGKWASRRFSGFLDFYWKKKFKLIRSLRRRGIGFRLVPSVPSVGVTGSVGKTTTCRLVARILAAAGKTVALATTQGMYVGPELVRKGDLAGGDSAGRLLVDPRVQAGVFELARGGLISDGMVLSAVDVGAVLNVFDNHIGLDGVDSREGLAGVKSVVVRNARVLAVLNADDPLCVAMAGSATAPVCFVSMRPDNSVLQGHLDAGGFGAYLDGPEEDPVLHLRRGRSEIGRLEGCRIPTTLGGVFRPALHNALFAAAIACGLGVQWEVIRDSLYDFRSTSESNPGRMNMLPGFPFDVLTTWADGPEAMAELSRYARSRSGAGRKRIMFCAAGNRPDWFLRKTALTVSGVYDTYLCSDWDTLRGRPPLETARLLAQTLRDEGVPGSCVTVAPSHDEALRMAFESACAGDLLVLVTFSEHKVWQAAAEALEVRRKQRTQD